MKILLFLITVLYCYSQCSAQSDMNLQRAKEKVVLTSLPFICEKNAPHTVPLLSFIRVANSKAPTFTYRDLKGTEKNSNEEKFCYIFRRFLINNQELLVVIVNREKYGKHFFVSYKDGQENDYLECSSFSNNDIATKQWKINANGEIMISELKIKESKPVSFYEEFVSLRAQRLDTFYKLDKLGKFKKIRSVLYYEKEYSKDYLENKNQNIWDGCEDIQSIK